MDRKALLFIALLLFSVSCNQKGGTEPAMSVIRISSEQPGTKVQIHEGSTVWNQKDRIGVYFSDGKPEQWTFLGDDLSMDGCIGGITHHSLTERKVALFPYSTDAVSESGIISVPIDGNPVLASISNNDELRFSYVCACIGLRLKGAADIDKMVLRSIGGEHITGILAVDTNASPITSMLKMGSSDNIVKEEKMHISAECESCIYFFMPAVNLAMGFSVDCHLAGGAFKTFDFPSRLALSQGDVYLYDIRMEQYVEDVWDYDFRYEDILGLPEHYSSGIFNEDTGYPLGKTFYTADNKELTFYTVDGKDEQTTVGVKYEQARDGEEFNWVQFGRVNSYVKMPGRKGYVIGGVYLTPRGKAGSPYFSLTPDGLSSISPKYYTFTGGVEFYVPLTGLKEGDPCYLMVNSSMVSLFRLQIKYLRKI